MDLCSIASGSSGNCSYVGNDNTKLLVDAGVSCKKIENGLKSIDIDPAKLHGVLITHEHSDHINGLGVLAKRYNIPIYGTKETLQAILEKKRFQHLTEKQLYYVEPDEKFQINDIMIEPFAISHDAVNPVCYTFQSEGKKIGMATDLGIFDDYIISKLASSDILLEANHDENMLMVGAYPYFLKQRISSNKGHLSNDSSAKLLCKLFHEKLKHITLAHLSSENNFEDLAYETVKVELSHYTNGNSLEQILSVAKRDIPGTVLSTT
jgi:phosphoribosyl 1,2-cyclic phosphodiesterase